jgi:hypothetical protein
MLEGMVFLLNPSIIGGLGISRATMSFFNVVFACLPNCHTAWDQAGHHPPGLVITQLLETKLIINRQLRARLVINQLHAENQAGHITA